MIGGLREAASRFALAAIVGAIGAVVFVQQPARAADLGGDCCADLEERVAELEATTVRKGNKKVSVQVYGKVNRFVAFWDDGHEQNAYVENNSYSSTRFGFRGKAKISGDWSGGYRMEMEDRTALSKELSQVDDDFIGESRTLQVRHSYMFIEQKKIGELRWGLTSSPKDDITKDTHVGGLIIDTMHSDFFINNAFFLRTKGFNTEVGNQPGAISVSRARYRDIARCYSSGSAIFDCSTRRNMVVFQSAKFFGSDESNGLWANWGWGEDDIWSASVRYKDKLGENWKLGGGVAYEDFRDENVNVSGGGLNGFKRKIKEWGGSASIMHTPTGLFAFGAFSTSETDDTNRINAGAFTGTSSPDMTAWDLQIGIQRGFIPLGNTTFWGGYTNTEDGIGGACGATRRCTANFFPGVTTVTEITGSEVNKWYLALDQEVVAGAMNLYLVYQHVTPDVDLVNSSLQGVSVPLDDFDTVYAGARIYF
jgi:predicted porin